MIWECCGHFIVCCVIVLIWCGSHSSGMFRCLTYSKLWKEQLQPHTHQSWDLYHFGFHLECVFTPHTILGLVGLESVLRSSVCLCGSCPIILSAEGIPAVVLFECSAESSWFFSASRDADAVIMPTDAFRNGKLLRICEEFGICRIPGEGQSDCYDVLGRDVGGSFW